MPAWHYGAIETRTIWIHLIIEIRSMIESEATKGFASNK